MRDILNVNVGASFLYSAGCKAVQIYGELGRKITSVRQWGKMGLGCL